MPDDLISGLCSDSTAERYPLMMKALRFTTPHEHQLELQFDVDGRGAERLKDDPKSQSRLRLMRVVVDECEYVHPPA